MFALTVLVYPLVLALLCLGAGLLVDRCSGRFLPIALLPAVGAAALIGLSQLSTSLASLAPATPWLMLAAALLGFALAWTGPREGRAATVLLALLRRRWWLALVPLLAYLLAIAPVLIARRASFSSFMALSDSAVHMIGADYLIHHGQHYAQLDLRNSYGQFIHDYYASGYPSGADTLFGGSALLLGLPLIWAFQPFNALILALSCCPAWVLARRCRLRGGWAALAALAITLPALVYGYELIGSVKELVALVMLLTLGALIVLQRRWLTRSPLHALPVALVLAGGVSALGVGFGAWAIAGAVALLPALIRELRARSLSAGQLASLLLAGALALLLAAWPTWMHVSQSLHVAQAISSTANPGNLQAPLKWTQAFGSWLHSSYKESPSGTALTLTDVLISLAFAGCLLGALALLLQRRLLLLGWILLTLLVWVVLSRSATTWVDAKALVLSSPVLLLLAWAGVGALIEQGRGSARGAMRFAGPLLGALLALALLGGALASDAIQYHSSNLAPTARYEELASINQRFAGRGPTLFSDFDEYSMYVLRHLDVGGPDFVYPPASLPAVGYGQPVQLDREPPAALARYPLIVARRDPSAAPPPAAYALAWQGVYYDVWARRRRAPAALLHIAARGQHPLSCARVLHASQLARAQHARMIAALAPTLVRLRLRRVHPPKGWGRQHGGFTMRRAGSVSLPFSLPRGGRWQLWLQGQFMPQVQLQIDGRRVGSLSAQLAGNSLVPDTAAPISLQLSAGSHLLRVTRTAFSLAPGNGGSAVLNAAFLTPARVPARQLRALALGASPRALCAGAYRWIELLPR